MGGCMCVGGCVCVCAVVRVCVWVCGCAGIQVQYGGAWCVLVYGVQQWKPRETDGQSSSFWQKESGLEVRLAISPGVVLDSAAGVAASVRSGSYRVVTVPTVRHAAHLPLWADRAVLLGHFLSCPATTNSQSVSPLHQYSVSVCCLVLAGSTGLHGLHVCMCSNLDSSLASSLSMLA